VTILPVQVYQPTSRFIIVERKDDLFPAISRKMAAYEETPEKRQAAMRKMNDKIRQQDTIEEWVGQIIVDCRERQIITYSGYLIRMIEQQQGVIDLAARVTHRLMKISAFGGISLEVDKGITIVYENIKVWEMKIVSR
jgi:hypothetical protein